MPFADWLKHIATISTVSTAEDNYGKESKTTTLLYDNIACRLGKGTARLVSDPWKEEKFIVTYKLYTLLEYNGAKNGDQVLIDSKKFIIFGWNTATWWEDNHYIYNIKADE